MHMWKKLLSCCLCLMLVLSSFAPLAGAEGGIATSTDTCDHQNTETIRREANPRDYVDAYFAYHEYTADIYITVVCNDCDAVVTPETLSGSETCRSAHEYVPWRKSASPTEQGYKTPYSNVSWTTRSSSCCVTSWSRPSTQAATVCASTFLATATREKSHTSEPGRPTNRRAT